LYDTAFKIRKELEKIYPKCFFSVGLEKPLKIGIMEDLLVVRDKLDVTPIPTEEELKASILVYTGSLSYRSALIRDGAVRVDLEGNMGVPVTDNEKLTAKTRHLAPKWKLTDEELTTVRERYLEHKARLYAESTGYFEPNHQNERNNLIAAETEDAAEASQQLNDQLKAALERKNMLVNPNESKPKLSLNRPKSDGYNV
jgi:sRNA-binding protein